MSVEEVERFERVGRGVMGLVRLWKSVENSKTQTENRHRESGRPTFSKNRTRKGGPPGRLLGDYRIHFRVWLQLSVAM